MSNQYELNNGEIRMQVEFKMCELSDNDIKEVVNLSQEWESEDLTYGYQANNKGDLIGTDLFLAHSNNEVVGYLFGKLTVLDKEIVPLEKGTRCFEIEEIYVKKDYRSQGIGKALFEYAKNYYGGFADYITLSTATKNYRSILHFYIDKLDMTFWSAKLFKKI